MKKLLIYILIICVVIFLVFFLFLNKEKEALDDGWTPIISLGVGDEKEALGVTITPLEILEDSRCPADVQCIWAGTVKVRTLLSSGLGSGEQIFELNAPITTEAEIVTLVNVEPVPVAGQVIEQSDYVLIFEIEKRNAVE